MKEFDDSKESRKNRDSRSGGKNQGKSYYGNDASIGGLFYYGSNNPY